LKDLDTENARLKRIVADKALDIDILKELNREILRARLVAGPFPSPFLGV
jgi:hypothetical protein